MVQEQNAWVVWFRVPPTNTAQEYIHFVGIVPARDSARQVIRETRDKIYSAYFQTTYIGRPTDGIIEGDTWMRTTISEPTINSNIIEIYANLTGCSQEANEMEWSCYIAATGISEASWIPPNAHSGSEEGAHRGHGQSGVRVDSQPLPPYRDGFGT